MNETIDICVFEPNKKPEMVTIDNTLEAMQRIVGGYIQVVKPWGGDVVLVCNEEGKVLNLPLNKIVVDGEWGINTTIATQKVLGTSVDGIVSKQLTSCKKYLQNCLTSSWEFKTSGTAGGSSMMKAIQRLVGAGVDGHAGKNTVIAMQKFLNARGFNCGSVDGYMGSNTVKAWQKYINSRL